MEKCWASSASIALPKNPNKGSVTVGAATAGEAGEERLMPGLLVLRRKDEIHASEESAQPEVELGWGARNEEDRIEAGSPWKQPDCVLRGLLQVHLKVGKLE